MDIKTIILGFLMDHDEMSGYDLKQALTISFSFFSNISYGSIYPSLKKMNQEKLVTMQVVEGENQRTRKVYSITSLGRAHFMEVIERPIEYTSGRSTFLPRLFFFSHLSPDKRKTLTLGFMESVRSIKALLDQTLPEIETKADPFQLLCARFGLRILEDLAVNIRTTISELEQIQAGAPK